MTLELLVWIAPFFSAAIFLFLERNMMEQAEIAVAPGLGFGEYGDGFIRIGLVENEQRIRQAARNLKKFLLTSNTAPVAAE